MDASIYISKYFHSAAFDFGKNDVEKEVFFMGLPTDASDVVLV